MQQEELAKLIEQAAKREQKRQADEIIETQIKILSAMFDKSTAYTNLMILAAYAGFFGLWQLTKDHIEKKLALWSALLILVSVVVFVAFEVVKMVYVQHNLSSKAKALKSPAVATSPAAVLKALQDIGRVHESVGMHLIRLWAVMLTTCIAAGMAGASLIGYAFVSALLK